jgi:hypothetical protein
VVSAINLADTTIRVLYKKAIPQNQNLESTQWGTKKKKKKKSGTPPLTNSEMRNTIDREIECHCFIYEVAL